MNLQVSKELMYRQARMPKRPLKFLKSVITFPNTEHIHLGSFPLTVTVTTIGYRSYKNPLNKAALKTVPGRGMTQHTRDSQIAHNYSPTRNLVLHVAGNMSNLRDWGPINAKGRDQ